MRIIRVLELSKALLYCLKIETKYMRVFLIIGK